MKNKHLAIGTKVRVYKKALRDYRPNPDTPLPDYKVGQSYKIDVYNTSVYPPYHKGIIVGGTYLVEGEIISDGYNNWEERESNTWVAHKKHFVYLVRPAFTMKPIKVLPENLEEDSGSMVRNQYINGTNNLPFSGSKLYWSDGMKKEQSDIMKEVPRDSKGRWI